MVMIVNPITNDKLKPTTVKNNPPAAFELLSELAFAAYMNFNFLINISI
jgi:hypothetical protein